MGLDAETTFRIRRQTFEGLRPTYNILDSRGENVLVAQRDGLGMREPTHFFRVGPPKETYLCLEPRPDMNYAIDSSPL